MIIHFIIRKRRRQPCLGIAPCIQGLAPGALVIYVRKEVRLITDRSDAPLVITTQSNKASSSLAPPEPESICCAPSK